MRNTAAEINATQLLVS